MAVCDFDLSPLTCLLRWDYCIPRDFFPFLVLLSSSFDRNRFETLASPKTNLTALEVGLGVLSGDQLLESSGHRRGLSVLGPPE